MSISLNKLAIIKSEKNVFVVVVTVSTIPFLQKKVQKYVHECGFNVTNKKSIFFLDSLEFV